MSDEIDVLITEQCGSVGDIFSYAKTGRNDLVQLSSQNNVVKSFQAIKKFLREVLLPYGYPESVSEDYLEYQIWDTLQAFCSTVTGAFTTRAVLRSVGVGDANATALSAATTWIMKEGTGMVGRIVFAWWKGNGLDSDCKKWRFFADILNDCAMVIELFLPFVSQFSMQVLCVTSVMKSIVGIAGGATRASITHHQAIKDNMAEISAKDGSQETVVNLLGSLVSLFLLNYFSSRRSEWIFVATLIVLHLYCNYLAVKSLVFKTFNNQRMALVLNQYFHVGTVLNPVKVNEKEDVIIGRGLRVRSICGFEIQLGQSVQEGLAHYKAADVKELLSVYNDKRYLILVNVPKRVVYVALEKGESTSDIIAAYFHAVCLGIATSIFNVFELDVYSKRQLHHANPITRLYTFMKSYETHVGQNRSLPLKYLKELNEFVKQENSMFFTAIHINGWSLDSHSMECGEWRTDWKASSKRQ